MHAEHNRSKPSYFTYLATALSTTLCLALPTHAQPRHPANAQGRAGFEKLHKAQVLAEQGKIDQAVSAYNEMVEGEKDREKRATIRMAYAVSLFKADRDQQAEEQFAKAIDDGLRAPEYAHYHMGLIRKEAGRINEAKTSFERVINSTAPGATAHDARFALGEMLLQDKQWKPAIVQFTALRKSLRNDNRYSEVVFNLLRAEMGSKKGGGSNGNVCKWARELYSKYPTSPSVREWGVQLQNNQVDGQKIACTASHKDLKTRIRRLWLGGDADRALTELKGLKDDVDEDGLSTVDTLLANLLASEGRLDEALQALLKHYDEQRNRPAYLLLLAKVSSRAGENQAAISAYQRAYDLAPGTKDGKNALFQAAFTSYQIQDYDGATSRFEKYVKVAPSPRMARDARWYLAWMKYLRHDYAGAYASFNALSKAPKIKTRRGRRVKVVASDAVATDRIRYWSAMSLLKMGKTDEAVSALQALARDPAIGYYALLSYHRLLKIPGAKLPTGVEVRLGLKKGGTNPTPTEEELKEAAQTVAAEAADEIATEKAETPVAVAEAGETAEVAGEEEGGEPGEMAEASPEEASMEEPVMSNFKDPKLASRFERARELAIVGLESSARRELREIEKRARSVGDRRLLMNEYAAVESYERSSFLAEVSFGSLRLREGLRGESRQYWEYAFPRAWDDSVVKAAKSTGVPEEMIWGIMRAESHYRQDAASPVGALGLMQLMPFTGRKVASLLNIDGFETGSLLNPSTNVRLGSRYLQRLLEKFSSKVPLAAASYNAGPHRVHAWVTNFGSLDMDEFIEHIPFIETRNYVKKVVRNYQIYNLLYSGGDQSLGWLIEPVGVQLKDSAPPKEVW